MTQITSLLPKIKKTKEVHYGKVCKQVEFGLSKTNHNYFSIVLNVGHKNDRTNDYFVDSKGKHFKYESTGCMHDEILSIWPSMADIVSLHLSNIDGTPMHAVEDGFYFYAKGQYDVLQKHLRVDKDELQSIITALRASEQPKQTFIKIVETLKPRWKVEADSVINKYELYAK